MANQKYSQMDPAGPLVGTELTCFSQGGVSVQSTLQAIAEFVGDVSFNYGDGIAYDAGTNTVSADINATNLQFTANQINTIQDIDLTASPTFETATLTSTTAGFLMPRMTTLEFDSIPIPDESLIAWSSSSLRYRLYNGSVYKELAYFDDLPIDTTAYAQMYFKDNAFDTVIALADTYVLINGAYIFGTNLNFSEAAGVLTYTGPSPKTFSVSCSLSCVLASTTTTVTVAIFKNGVEEVASSQSTFAGNTVNVPYVISVDTLVPLENSDTLSARIKNDTADDNIVVQDFSVCSSTVGGSIGNVQDQVVTSWDGSTASVGVTAGVGIDITSGVITNTGSGEDNVIIAYNGSTTPVNLQPGTNITFDLDGTINATGGGGSGDLEDAYTNGDGTMTSTGNSKPLKFISNSYATNPNFVMEKTPSGLTNTVISNIFWIGRNNVSDTINFASIRAIESNVNPGTESVNFDFLGYTAGSSKIYLRYSGGNDQIQCNSRIVSNDGIDDTTISANSLVTTNGSQRLVSGSLSGDVTTSGLASTLATVNGDVGTFGSDNLIPQITVNGKGLITAVTEVATPKPNVTLGTTLIPTTNYPSVSYVTVWNTLSGTDTVNSGTFDIGDTIEVDITGVVYVDIPTANADIGSTFRFSFGTAIVNAVSNSFPLENSSTRRRNFALKIKITRRDSTTITASASGYYFNNAQVCEHIAFPTIMSTNTFPYNDLLNYTINLEYQNGNAVGNQMSFICRNLNIKQYS